MLVGHGDVGNRQHHEDVRLDEDDQQLEHAPGKSENHTETEAYPAREQAGNQHEHQLAAEHVAEQSHRQRNRFGQVLDQIEDDVGRGQNDAEHDTLGLEWRGDLLLQEAAGALDLDREEHGQDENAQRQRERRVDIGRGHRLEMEALGKIVAGNQHRDAADQVDRDEVDEVHQQHPHEDGQAQRREKAAVAVEQVLDLAIDEFHDQLDEGLALARHAGRGLARETIEPDEENGAYEQAHDPAVEMEIASEHLHVVEVDMVLDVFVQAAATFRGLHQRSEERRVG